MNELPSADALFTRFLTDSKNFPAARARFQDMITDLVSVSTPGASEVAFPGGGDWGIDTYVGSLGGKIVVWQSKFFLSWGEDQKAQVRDSFNEVIKKADAEGFTVRAWTLCVPSVLPPDVQKWFDRWAARVAREKKLAVDLKNGSRIRRELMQDDASWVRAAYFPTTDPGGAHVPVQIAADLSHLANTLFIRQLNVAGHPETDAAKGYFFAAEAMARDIAAKGVPAQLDALAEVEVEIHGEWESAFNAGLPSANSEGVMSGIVSTVMNSVGKLPASSELPLRPAHRKGLTHRLVESARAGWIATWREVAASHSGPRASELVMGKDSDGGSDTTS